MNIPHSFYLRSELSRNVIDEVKLNINTFNNHLDVKNSKSMLFSECSESIETEISILQHSICDNVRIYKSLLFEIRDDIYAMVGVIRNVDVFPEAIILIRMCMHFMKMMLILVRINLHNLNMRPIDWLPLNFKKKMNTLELINWLLKMINDGLEQYKHVLKIALMQIVCADQDSRSLGLIEE